MGIKLALGRRTLEGVNSILRPLGVELNRRAGKISSYHDIPDHIQTIRQQVAAYTMTSAERIFTLCEATEYIVGRNIPGGIVECGVWRGGSAMAAALTLQRMGAKRHLHLFDTFEGMPPTTDRDRVIGTEQPAEDLRQEAIAKAGNYIAVGAEDVEANLRSIGYDMDYVHLHKGMVEDTVPIEAPAQIALLRLDTDWYQSTRHELMHLWPRLAAGGVLIVDDYGHFSGCRDAVNEYFADQPVLLGRIDYTGRIAIKCIP